MRALPVLISISLYVFVCLVHAADNYQLSSQNPEMTVIMDRLSALNDDFAVSLTGVIHEGSIVAKESLALMMGEIEKSLKELDMPVDAFDKKCDAVMVKLESTFNGVMGGFPDLSESANSGAESEFLARIYSIFEEAVKVLNGEYEALQGKFKAQAQEVTNFGYFKINSGKNIVLEALSEGKILARFREVYSQYRSSTQPFVELHNLSTQSLVEPSIFQKSFNSIFNLAWNNWVRSMYEELHKQSSQLQQQVSKCRRDKLLAKCDQEDSLASFEKVSSKCLVMSDTSNDRLRCEREKILREGSQISRKHYKELMRVEILLVKAQARLSCEESKIFILMNCLNSALKSDEGAAQ